MKKLILLLFVCFSVNAFSQKDFYLMLNSNIEYAPIGAGIIFSDRPGIQYFANLKFSEDYFNRELSTSNEQEFTESRPTDVNETIITAGIFKNITAGFDLVFGAGILTGKFYQPHYTNDKLWYPVDKSPAMSPVLTWGLAYNINRFKLLFGYEVAFVKPENYPVAILNQNSIGRLTSATIGIAFNLVGQNMEN